MTPAEMEQRLVELEEDVASLRVADAMRDDRETIEALREAIAEIDRGEGIPAEQALAQIRAELGLPARSRRASGSVA